MMEKEKRLIEVETVIRKIRKANCADCDNCNAVLCRACWCDDVREMFRASEPWKGY